MELWDLEIEYTHKGVEYKGKIKTLPAKILMFILIDHSEGRLVLPLHIVLAIETQWRVKKGEYKCNK